MSKITANRKDIVELKWNFITDISLKNSWDFEKLFRMMASKDNFKVDNKVTSIVSIYVFIIMSGHILILNISLLKSFLKVSGFYYTWVTIGYYKFLQYSQQCYYERTMPYISLKISEYLNRVIFQNYSMSLLPSKQKHVQSWQQKRHKNFSVNVIWVPLSFLISWEHIL